MTVIAIDGTFASGKGTLGKRCRKFRRWDAGGEINFAERTVRPNSEIGADWGGGL